jgi:hypothetical protein
VSAVGDGGCGPTTAFSDVRVGVKAKCEFASAKTHKIRMVVFNHLVVEKFPHQQSSPLHCETVAATPSANVRLAISMR